ncbi:MAG: hypothetical protein K2P76_08550 [Lachnospiraceae bacterium]|nr:hypothetical protein [Lachnospiraceae bacterium]
MYIEKIEWLDTDDILLCETEENTIEKMEGVFKYKLKGIRKGIVEVYGFDVHIDEQKIPSDITNGMHIQFVISRIDIW